MDTLKIGLIVKPQGIKGEIKVKPLTDDIDRFKKLKEVIIDDKTFKVLGVKIVPDFCFIVLDGITDRNSAELLRGKFLLIDRANAIKLPKNTFFICDIIGCQLSTENGLVGVVSDVTSLKTDIFTVLTTDKKIMRFPFLADSIIKVDIENKKIVLKEQRLKEISVYED